jgi:hypothetical protein
MPEIKVKTSYKETAVFSAVAAEAGMRQQKNLQFAICQGLWDNYFIAF